MRNEAIQNVVDNEFGSLAISDYFIIWTSKSNKEVIKVSWKHFDKAMKSVPEHDRNHLELFNEVAINPISVKSSEN